MKKLQKKREKKINFWKEQISCTYRCCRWSEGKLSFLGRDVYTVIFLCTSLHSILAKSKVIITSQTKVFIKLNVKPDLEMNNENQKTRIKLIGYAQHCINFPKPLPAPSPRFFENWSNLWGKTSIWQQPPSRSSVVVVLLIWSCFEFLCQFE